MKVLIITEKPSVSRALATTARSKWPFDDVTFLHVCPYVGAGWGLDAKLPRGLKLKSFPVVRQPQYQVSAWNGWRHTVPVAAKVGPVGRLEPVPPMVELVTEADLIVFAGDLDRSGASSFSLFITQILGADRVDTTQALIIPALDKESVERAFEQMTPFGESAVKTLATAGMVKRHFDWNWALNARAILGPVLSSVGVPADAPFFPKYALQLLYFLRDQPALGDGEIVSHMFNWRGTGHYGGPQHLGSATSSSRIINTLCVSGLLGSPDPQRTRLLQMTDRGHALLAALHPDCEDPDLPFRLDAWCEQGDAAYPAVDRYIRTFFGKQMRFAGRAAVQA